MKKDLNTSNQNDTTSSSLSNFKYNIIIILFYVQYWYIRDIVLLSFLFRVTFVYTI